MRGNPIIGRRIPNPISNHSTKQAPFLSSSHFSTSSSGGGGGRGRGGSAASNYFDFIGRAPGKPDSEAPGPSTPPPPPQRQPPQSGTGHGRGGGNPILPAFSSFISSVKSSQSQFQSQSPIGRGRGGGPVEPRPSRKPTADSQSKSVPPEIQFTQSDDPPISGLGRGIPHEPVGLSPKPVEENRHIKVRPKPKSSIEVKAEGRSKMSREDAVKRAVSILSQQRGKLGGMGRGGGSGRGRGRGRGGTMEDSDDEFEEDLFADDNAFGEQLAEMIGAENMNKLADAFEGMSEKVLPSPLEDAFVDAMHTNYMIEFEPEYLMGEFDQNPDIDEKPPMPLQDVLEKVKPFIMAYEGIQSHEQWEEVVEETMKRVPLLKEIVDHYSGPDRVTAKKQQEELERVAKAIPASAPASVKRFADCAVLSLQSNPGWGFDKKCQFMDKLVREVNQCYN